MISTTPFPPVILIQNSCTSHLYFYPLILFLRFRTVPRIAIHIQIQIFLAKITLTITLIIVIKNLPQQSILPLHISHPMIKKLNSHLQVVYLTHHFSCLNPHLLPHNQNDSLHIESQCQVLLSQFLSKLLSFVTMLLKNYTLTCFLNFSIKHNKIFNLIIIKILIIHLSLKRGSCIHKSFINLQNQLLSNNNFCLL